MLPKQRRALGRLLNKSADQRPVVQNKRHLSVTVKIAWKGSLKLLTWADKGNDSEKYRNKKHDTECF